MKRALFTSKSIPESHRQQFFVQNENSKWFHSSGWKWVISLFFFVWFFFLSSSLCCRAECMFLSWKARANTSSLVLPVTAAWALGPIVSTLSSDCFRFTSIQSMFSIAFVKECVCRSQHNILFYHFTISKLSRGLLTYFFFFRVKELCTLASCFNECCSAVWKNICKETKKERSEQSELNQDESLSVCQMWKGSVGDESTSELIAQKSNFQNMQWKLPKKNCTTHCVNKRNFLLNIEKYQVANVRAIEGACCSRLNCELDYRM